MKKRKYFLKLKIHTKILIKMGKNWTHLSPAKKEKENFHLQQQTKTSWLQALFEF